MTSRAFLGAVVRVPADRDGSVLHWPEVTRYRVMPVIRVVCGDCPDASGDLIDFHPRGAGTSGWS
jgi:hypothetical protein